MKGARRFGAFNYRNAGDTIRSGPADDCRGLADDAFAVAALFQGSTEARSGVAPQYRQPPIPELVDYPLAKASVINFGLPDITSLGLSSASDHGRLRKAIETCLRNFEPRLMDVRVTLEGSDTADRRLRFHIEGNMKLDPAPEEISFDTVLELSSGEYKVK